MSREYDLYLEQHKKAVADGFYWIKKNLPELIVDLYGVDYEHQIAFDHDTSKTNLDEYVPYDLYFYGGNRSYQVVQDFNYAWLKHIHRNPHHWQYWVLNNDEPTQGQIILEMPYQYILEMICDWWAFSWRSGDLTEIFTWYDNHKDYMKLGERTRVTVEDILAQIKTKLLETV